jgi:hypothetical protein
MAGRKRGEVPSQSKRAIAYRERVAKGELTRRQQLTLRGMLNGATGEDLTLTQWKHKDSELLNAFQDMVKNKKYLQPSSKVMRELAKQNGITAQEAANRINGMRAWLRLPKNDRPVHLELQHNAVVLQRPDTWSHDYWNEVVLDYIPGVGVAI